MLSQPPLAPCTYNLQNHTDLDFIIVSNVQEQSSKKLAILPNHKMPSAKRKEGKFSRQICMFPNKLLSYKLA
jgi:hypothetical protein